MPYKAKLGSDGFYEIRDVPVFSEVPKGVKGAPFDIDGAWLRAALARSRIREREGYLAPLHFEHHAGGEKNFKAGHYRLTRVGTLRVGGESKSVLFADFVKLPESVFQAIMRNEWPYRSVEIVRYSDHEIESVALLDDDTPFHKFELLNAGTIEISGEAEATDVPVPVAFARTKNGHAVLFRLTEKEGRMKVTVRQMDSGSWSITDGAGSPIEGFSDADVTVVGFDSGEDKLPEDEAKLRKMAKAIKARLKKMGCDDDDGEGDKGGEHSSRHLPFEVADLAEFAARIDVLEKQVADQRLAAESAENMAKAVNDLRRDGYHVSGLTEETIRKFSADSDGLKSFISHYRATAAKDGTKEPSDAESKADDPVVAKYAALGVEAHKTAVAALAAFSELVDAGMRRGTDDERARFVQTYCNARGFKAA